MTLLAHKNTVVTIESCKNTVYFFFTSICLIKMTTEIKTSVQNCVYTKTTVVIVVTFHFLRNLFLQLRNGIDNCHNSYLI